MEFTFKERISIILLSFCCIPIFPRGCLPLFLFDSHLVFPMQIKFFLGIFQHSFYWASSPFPVYLNILLRLIVLVPIIHLVLVLTEAWYHPSSKRWWFATIVSLIKLWSFMFGILWSSGISSLYNCSIIMCLSVCYWLPCCFLIPIVLTGDLITTLKSI